MPNPWSVLVAVIAFVTASANCSAVRAQITRAPAPSEPSRVLVETAVSGIANPWGFQFLPDGRLLITEIRGTLRIAAPGGKLSAAIPGVPAVVAQGQGGLLDVALAPDFATSGTIFLSFSESRGAGKNGTSIARARLVRNGEAARLEDVTIIFRQKPDFASTFHFGSRFAFAPDGTLFITVGERALAPNEAQNASNHFGKVIHLKPDGTIPADNPKRPGWAPEVWSIGHRNPQAAAINPATGKLWTVEHGARGGDEINAPQAGRNYGWPVITYGRDYSGAKIGIGTAKDGLEQPLYYWDPSIAPSGMAFYTGDRFPTWKGNLFVGALAGQHLARLVLDGDKVVAEERLLADLKERIRDVRQGPDGLIYVATDNINGRILRISPQR